MIILLYILLSIQSEYGNSYVTDFIKWTKNSKTICNYSFTIASILALTMNILCLSYVSLTFPMVPILVGFIYFTWMIIVITFLSTTRT